MYVIFLFNTGLRTPFEAGAVCLLWAGPTLSSARSSGLGRWTCLHGENMFLATKSYVFHGEELPGDPGEGNQEMGLAVCSGKNNS